MSQGEDGGDEESEVPAQDIHRAYRRRARAVMMGFYSQDESTSIYGLKLQQVPGNHSLWDVYHKSVDDEVVYLDTINIEVFATASQLINQIRSYLPRDRRGTADDVSDEDQGPDPSPSFQ